MMARQSAWASRSWTMTGRSSSAARASWARKAVETAASIPLERIVLETDCPYMSPEPFRGKRNDPGKLYRMAEKLAEIRGLSVEEIHAITMENGKKLYRM